MKIVVIGGTGLIGSKLVAKLAAHGHDAVPASPGTGVNTLTGEGLTEALTGADVVVDVSNSPSFEDTAVLEFFETSTRNILGAEAAAGVRHHVALAAPLNNTIEIAGPQPLRFEDFVRQRLRSVGDQRVVVTDPQARYFGARLSKRALLPGDGAQLGPTQFADWLRHQAPSR